jgi:hypothetical protein
MMRVCEWILSCKFEGGDGRLDSTVAPPISINFSSSDFDGDGAVNSPAKYTRKFWNNFRDCIQFNRY